MNRISVFAFALAQAACSSYGEHPTFAGDEDPDSVGQWIERAVTVERASNVYGQGIPGGGGATKTACYGTDVCFVTTNGAASESVLPGPHRVGRAFWS